ncbi:GNAT family N-acetyltransferase [Sulfitobacter sp. SK011]|nr:GNAT family N-acetyltransferase [Sulfitobacter sp. SK011]
MRIYGEKGAERGGAHICSDRGAALWVPPGVHPDENALDALLERSVAPDSKAELFDVYSEFDRAHPSEPHWFLPLMGVDPFMKKRGIGTALMAHGLNICDQDGTIAYLESPKPENVPFYERFGFRSHYTIDVARHPKVVTMVRPAKKANP